MRTSPSGAPRSTGCCCPGRPPRGRRPCNVTPTSPCCPPGRSCRPGDREEIAVDFEPGVRLYVDADGVPQRPTEARGRPGSLARGCGAAEGEGRSPGRRARRRSDGRSSNTPRLGGRGRAADRHDRGDEDGVGDQRPRLGHRRAARRPLGHQRRAWRPPALPAVLLTSDGVAGAGSVITATNASPRSTAGGKRGDAGTPAGAAQRETTPDRSHPRRVVSADESG